MNAYTVFTTDVWTSPSYDPPEPPEPADYWALIVAETRGKAKSLAWRDWSKGGKVWPAGEYTDLRAQVIAHDVPGPARLATYDPDLNLANCQRGHDVSLCDECDLYGDCDTQSH